MDHEQIKHTVLTDEIILINSGRMLDNNNAHLMSECLSNARSKGTKFAIIDMEDLDFLSSAGVGSILGSIESFREIGGDIIICNASTTILHIFSVLDLGDYLSIRDTQQDAISSCNKK